MAVIQFEDGRKVVFEGTPTPEDIAHVEKALYGGTKPIASTPASAPAAPIGKLKSAVLGASQGASMGFGDEGAALIADIGKGMMTGKMPTVEGYRAARDQFRGKISAARKENPKSYIGGELAGSAATMLIPGTQATTIPKLAAIGAAQGLGNSEADLTRGNFGGAAKDTAVGGAAGAVLGAVAPAVVKGAAKFVPYAGKKLMSSVLGPSEDAITAYLKDPFTIKSASMEGLAEQMPQVANKFKAIIKETGAKAKAVLSTSRFIEPGANDAGGAFTKDEVMGIVASARRKLGGVYTDESKTASTTIKRIAENLKKIRNTVSQKQVHDLITDLDKEIPWDKVIRSPETVTATDKTLINLRTGLDGVLKDKNEAYAKAVKPVEEAISARNDFVRKFSISRVKGEGYVPSDTTYSRVKSSLNEGKIDTDRVVANVKRITGIDIAPQVQNAKHGAEFIGGKTNGSRSVNTMAAAGGAAGFGLGKLVGAPGIGSAAGAAAGAGVGSVIDRKGGEMAAGLLDKYLAGKQAAGKAGAAVVSRLPAIIQKAPLVLGKYAPIMRRAATLGVQQVALQHWLLMESDKDYGKLVSKIEGGTSAK